MLKLCKKNFFLKLTDNPINIPKNGAKYCKYKRINFNSKLNKIKNNDDGKKEITNNVKNVRCSLKIFKIIKFNTIARLK